MAKKTVKPAAKSGKARSVPKKTVIKRPVTKKTLSAAKGSKQLEQSHYKSLRLQKRIKHPVDLPSVWYLTRTAAITLWQYKRVFIGITLVYGLLNVLFAQSLSGGLDINTLKQTYRQASTGHLSALGSSFRVFTSLVGSSGSNANPSAGVYQLILGLVASLAIIWSLRQVLAGSKVRSIRDSYYLGMYPLVPFVLVLSVIGLQLVPLLTGSKIYTTVIGDNIAIYFVEKLIWALLYGLLALLSLYMISSSVFALYIVTLPDMTPMKALRSARELVRYRRWTVLRKILYLPVILLFVAAVIMLPVITWLAPLAQLTFFLLSIFALLASHAYMYTLYRELLNE